MSRLSIMPAATIIFALAACGGGGGSSGLSSGATPTPDNPSAGGNGYRYVQIPNDDNDYRLEIKGKSYRGGDKVDISAYPQGLSVEPFKSSSIVYKDSNGDYRESLDGNIHLYKQAYSVVLGSYIRNLSDQNNPTWTKLVDKFAISSIQGEITPSTALPNSGNYTYKGQAFNQSETGALTYTVDFSRRRGQGSITGLSEAGTITLQNAPIAAINEPGFKGMGISGDAASAKLGAGKYGLGFFGPKANEIAGMVELTRPGNPGSTTAAQDFEIGFGGKR